MFEEFSEQEKCAISGEDLWRQIQPQIEQATEQNVVDELKNYQNVDFGSEKSDKYEREIKREKEFVIRVFDGISKFCSENPGKDKKILFDIDDTIGRTKFDEKTGEITGTQLRPSIYPLLEFAKNSFPEIDFGFLTNRGKEAVEEQLKNSCQLEPISGFINGELIFSSRNSNYSNSISGFEGKAIDFLKQHPLIKKMTDGELEEISWTIARDHIEKLGILKELSEKNPESAFMPVDDLDYAGWLKHGVSLYPDAIF